MTKFLPKFYENFGRIPYESISIILKNSLFNDIIVEI